MTKKLARYWYNSNGIAGIRDPYSFKKERGHYILDVDIHITFSSYNKLLIWEKRNYDNLLMREDASKFIKFTGDLDNVAAYQYLTDIELAELALYI